MELAGAGWVLLGTAFRCLGMPAALGADVAALLQGFPPPEPGAEAVPFAVEESGGAAALLFPGSGARWPLGTADPVPAQIEYALIDEAIRRTRGRYVLHAGAVAGPGGTCLIAGESGAGKTSLTLWLWASGLRLLTDDLCPVRHGSLLPEPFPRALHMDAEYSPRLLERIPPRPASYPADYYPFPAPETPEPAPPVTTLLLIGRGPSPEGELSPLSQAEASHGFLRAAIRTPGFDFEQALTDMLRLAAGCRAWRLRSSTPEGAAERALEVVGGSRT